ncbi:tail fiber domain-containing protein [Desertivirga arenae]|uniref:tail fiber domain-containing protein n=1 Tax=Desertivirga arenae TaxID=2810309 RepID=UPI001A95ED4F|nr:tail fiber domain-containing protein [Pedobacter sp. SYSU D00823]
MSRVYRAYRKTLGKSVCVFLLSLTCGATYAQNVGINSTGNAPKASAGLDVDFSNKGMLIPRVQLTSNTDQTTIASPTTSLLVYNLLPASSGTTAVFTGFYFWSGTVWTPVGNWGTSGTATVNTATVGIGTTSPDASAALDITSGSKGILIPRVALTGTGDVNTINPRTNGLLVYASGSNGDVTPGFYYWNNSLWTRLSTGGAAAASQWTSVTTTVNNVSTTNIYKNNNGNVGIGTTTPTELLEVRGDAAFGTDANRTVKISNENDVNSIDIYTAADKPLRISNNGLNNGSSLQLKSSTENHLFSFEGKGGFRYYSRNSSAEKFRVNDAGDIFLTTTGVNTATNALGNINSFYQINAKNSNAGADASTDIVATNDNATESYINMGINSTGNASAGVLGGANMAYLHCLGTSDLSIGNSVTGKFMRFFTSNGTPTERMRITPTGEIGIGVTTVTSGYKLEIAGGTMAGGDIMPKVNNTYDLGSSTLKWNDVYATNGVFQTSDIRLKTNIANLKYGLKEVMALQPVSYNWKDQSDTKNKIGLIAQDTKKIVPEVVIGDETKENLGMNYAELVPVLINAIKEQQQQINDLKEANTASLKQIQELKEKIK